MRLPRYMSSLVHQVPGNWGLAFFPDFASFRVIRRSAVTPLYAFIAEDSVGRGEVIGHSRCRLRCRCRLGLCDLLKFFSGHGVLVWGFLCSDDD